LYELRVHQIELEMQNEELRQFQIDLDASRERYFDFYDMAPVGCCTVNDKWTVIEASVKSGENPRPASQLPVVVQESIAEQGHST